MKGLSNIVSGVVDGLVAQMQSGGEGLLPLVLALNPHLGADGLDEADPEFDRRGRAQSAAERRFFRQVKPALRNAITAVLTDVASKAYEHRSPAKRRHVIRAQNVRACGRTLALLMAARKKRIAARLNCFPPGRVLPLSVDALASFGNLPLRERLNDRLVNAMIAIDEAIQMCELEGDATWLAPSISVEIIAAYDHMNTVMKAIFD